MATKEVIFADRLTNLSIHNGLVRIDLGVIAGTGKTKEGKDALKLETTHQLVMPLEAFAAAVAAQQQLLKQVVEAGKKRGAAKAPPRRLRPDRAHRAGRRARASRGRSLLRRLTRAAPWRSGISGREPCFARSRSATTRSKTACSCRCRWSRRRTTCC